MFMDRFADALNTIKNNERIGRQSCIVSSTKLIRAVLDVMAREKYIKGYVAKPEGRVERLEVQLSNNINNVRVVKPRQAISKGEIQKYEQQYIPSRDFGMLILSTPHGVLSNREAREKGTGGRLLAYVY